MAGLEHFGPGLLCKLLSPQVPFWVYLVAAEFLDIVWCILYLLGLEGFNTGGWTHSLVGAFFWVLLVALVTWLITKKLKISISISLAVSSHWILDFITHPMAVINPSDQGLPLYPGAEPSIGLGLYSTIPGLIIGQIIFWGTGIIGLVLSRHTMFNKNKNQDLHQRRIIK